MLTGGKINTNGSGRPGILIAPLDWGLGHITRCLPIIKKLTENKFQVIVATEGKHISLVQLEFPEVIIVEIPGYRLKYSRKRWLMGLKILFQIPRILKTIRDERQWLKEYISKNNIKTVISDCRYGLYDPSIYSIFITHQLMIKTPFGKIANRILQKWNYSFIEKFNECWVPDWAGKINLAGDLSHPSKLPFIPVKYIGPLSRFEIREIANTEKIDLLIVLSGPEPQRTIFERIIIEQLAQFQGTVVVVRGLPSEIREKKQIREFQFMIDHLPAAELNDLLLRSRLIICRSGYSTIMDLVKLRKKAVLVPTPGQTEQEYLAEYLMKHQIQFAVNQKKFFLKNILSEVSSFPFKSIVSDMLQFEHVLNELSNKLEQSYNLEKQV